MIDLDYILRELDEIEVDKSGRCRWTDVANAATLMKLELRRAASLLSGHPPEGTIADAKLAIALHEASVYGIGATSDTNQKIILEAAMAHARKVSSDDVTAHLTEDICKSEKSTSPEQAAKNLVHKFEMESMALHATQRNWLEREIAVAILNANEAPWRKHNRHRAKDPNLYGS